MSCRFQPNYRGDADYRGVAGLRTEPCLDFTFDIGDGVYIPDPTIPVLIQRDRFLDLACGQTITDLSISDTSNHALYRTTDLTANHGYLARFFLARADEVGDYCVRLGDVQGFSPYVTVHRSGEHQWQGELVGGCFNFSVATGQTGPITIEVSTVFMHEKGTFFIQFQCPAEDDFSILHLSCVDAEENRLIDSTHTFRGFDFSQNFPGNYTIQLANVSGFTPYIYIDGTLNNLPLGGNSLVVPFVGAGHNVLGFVASLAGLPGQFDISITCPAPPSPVHLTPACVAAFNTIWSAGIDNVMNYVHDTLYYENNGNPGLRLNYDIAAGKWYFSFGFNSSFYNGTSSTNPYGIYNDASLGTVMEVIV